MAMARRFRRTALTALLAVCAASLPVMAAWLFQSRYERQLWDPRHAALVNGRPILREDVEEVLAVGMHPPLAPEGGGGGAVTMGQILEKLIDEELVLQAAGREGLEVGDGEIEAFLERQSGAWGCGPGAPRGYMCRMPKGDELDALAAAVRRRLLMERAASLASRRGGRRSPAGWERYLAAWARGHSAARVYEVRALLAERTPGALRVLGSAGSRRGGLAGLEADLKAQGLGCIVSEPMVLDPRRAAASLPGVTGLDASLAEAAAGPLRLTGVLELGESYAVLEILADLPPPTPEELALSARAGYEGQVAGEAFRAYVAALRAGADIQLNPNFLAPPPSPAAGAAPGAAIEADIVAAP